MKIQTYTYMWEHGLVNSFDLLHMVTDEYNIVCPRIAIQRRIEVQGLAFYTVHSKMYLYIAYS